MALRDPRTRSLMHQHARNADPTGSRSYGDATDIARDVFHQVSKEQLIPAIANRTRNAISVDGREVFLYQRLRSGHRCSCWESAETTPHAQCPICFGVGFVGGFHKFGTDLYMFDPTSKWMGLNVTLNPLMGVPPWFGLTAGTTSGYIEWSQQMELATYYGIDSWRFEYRKNQGEVKLYFKLVGSDPSFIPFTEQSFFQRILVANGGMFKFRVKFTRTTPNDLSPIFQFFFFRTLVKGIDPPILIVDIPRRNESNLLAEYGVLETFTPIQMAFSDEVQRINLEDLVIRLHDMTRWKIIEASPNDPQNILTSHDCQLRRVFQHEGMWSVPL